MEANTNMEVRKPENPSCTFKTTGKCNCKPEKTDAKMANEVSSQSDLSIKGVNKN